MIMNPRVLRQHAAGVAASVLLVPVTFGWVGCDPLDVADPTRLEEPNVANPTGADLMRKNALRRLFFTAATSADRSGALSDEYHVVGDASISTQGRLDLRLDDPPNSEIAGLYGEWQQLRVVATLALKRIEADAPQALRSAHMGQMLAVHGFAALRMGEDFCPGFPLHELDGYTVVYQQPLQTTDEVLERALADLDSAIVLAADSARISEFARVTRGRTLLGLGRLAEAAAAVEPVPTDYAFIATFGDVGSNSDRNPLGRFTMPGMSPVGSVSDGEGDNGIDFVSAADPRLPTTWDDVYQRWRPNKYLEWSSPMVLSSGVEARLIEAEAALAIRGPWLEILNDLRATQISPALEPLEDPGDASARVDLVFRERAFWLFGTGHRLADLRRLVDLYDRPSETVFPIGTHPTGAVYETATSIVFPWEAEAEFNPAVTGCTSS